MKKSLSLLLAVMLIFSSMIIGTASVSAATAPADAQTISTTAELKTALTNGGVWTLEDDVKFPFASSVIKTNSDLTIYGNGHTLTIYNGYSIISPVHCTFTAYDLTLNGNNGSVSCKCAIDTSQAGSNNADTIISLTNCTVKNYISSTRAGAINLFGNSQATLTDCYFTGNQAHESGDPDAFSCGADVWAGAGAKLTINGGKFDGGVYGNSGTSSAATIDINDAVLERVSVSTAGVIPAVTIENSAVNVLIKQEDKEAFDYDSTSVIGSVKIDETGEVTPVTTTGFLLKKADGTFANYADFAEALAAAQDGSTITALDPSNVVEGTAFSSDKNVKIEGVNFNSTRATAEEGGDAFLKLTGTDVVVKDCTFSGIFYNAIETTQSTTKPLNRATITGCTFSNEAANGNNCVNFFSTVDGAKISVTDNEFNCQSNTAAIGISNYTGTKATYTIKDNKYNPATEGGDWDSFILFHDTTTNGTNDFANTTVNVSGTVTTSNNALYKVYSDEASKDTTNETKVVIKENGKDADVTAPAVLSWGLKLNDGKVTLVAKMKNVDPSTVKIDDVPATYDAENDLYYVEFAPSKLTSTSTFSSYARFYGKNTVSGTDKTMSYTYSSYYSSLSEDDAALARAIVNYCKASYKAFDGQTTSIKPTNVDTTSLDAVDPTPAISGDVEFCGCSIDCDVQTGLIIYAKVEAGTTATVNGQTYTFADCGSECHTYVEIPVNNVNTAVTLNVNGSSITYSVMQAAALLKNYPDTNYSNLAYVIGTMGNAVAARA